MREAGSPVVAVLADHVRRLGPGIDHRGREERARRIRGDLQRVVVGRGDAQGAERHLTGVDRGPVLDALHRLRPVGEVVRRLGRRLVADGEGEVLGRERHAVGPDEALANLEGPGQLIGRDGPALRGHRDQLAGGGVIDDERLLHQVGAVLTVVDGQVLVQVRTLRSCVRQAQDLLRRRRRVGRQRRRRGGKAHGDERGGQGQRENHFVLHVAFLSPRDRGRAIAARSYR